MHHGGSFKVYMQNKNLKLQEQFEAAQLQQAQQSELFKGVAIHVNGRTVPSHQELKQIMVRAVVQAVQPSMQPRHKAAAAPAAIFHGPMEHRICIAVQQMLC